MNPISHNSRSASISGTVGEGPVPSPCIGVCQMNAQTGLCEGCQRTLDEIAQWGTAGDDWKRAVWEEIARRNGL